MKLLLALLFLITTAFAQKITIFAASDLKFALDSIKENFLNKYPKNTINIIYGSSGKGRVQIAHGAPYDLYFSANIDYVNTLYKNKKLITKPKLYAVGRLVIWSKNKNFDAKKGFQNLLEPWAKKIAIANPAHAPYGQKAKQALESVKIYKKIKSKIVLGENISQTANYINIQAADIGIIALSLVISPDIANSKYSSYYLIDNKLHKPIKQAYAITSYAKKSDLTKKFYNFFQTKESVKIMKNYGFAAK